MTSEEMHRNAEKREKKVKEERKKRSRFSRKIVIYLAICTAILGGTAKWSINKNNNMVGKITQYDKDKNDDTPDLPPAVNLPEEDSNITQFVEPIETPNQVLDERIAGGEVQEYSGGVHFLQEIADQETVEYLDRTYEDLELKLNAPGELSQNSKEDVLAKFTELTDFAYYDASISIYLEADPSTKDIVYLSALSESVKSKVYSTQFAIDKILSNNYPSLKQAYIEEKEATVGIDRYEQGFEKTKNNIPEIIEKADFKKDDPIHKKVLDVCERGIKQGWFKGKEYLNTLSEWLDTKRQEINNKTR